MDFRSLFNALRLTRARTSRCADLANPELLRLRKENTELKSTIDFSQLGYVSVDSNAKVIATNHSAETLLGNSKNQLLNTTLYRYFSDSDLPHLQHVIQQATHGTATRLRTTAGGTDNCIPVMLYLCPVKSQSRKICQITLVDLSEHKAAEDSLRIARNGLHHIASHDALTRLPNRVGFNDRLETTLIKAKNLKQQVAVMILDLDQFKRINEPLGHQTGDQLLKAVANRLKNCVPFGSDMGRLWGDEFAITVENINTHEEIACVAKEIQEQLAKPYFLGDHELITGASIGVGIYPEHASTAEGLIRAAGNALNVAKSEGRNRTQFFKSGLDNPVHQRFKLESDLRRDIRDDCFELYFQPQYDLSKRGIVSYEALLRWNHPQRGLLSPDSFIDLVEETGLIEPLGTWVMEEACTRFAQLKANGNPVERISVNVSARQFAKGDLCVKIKDILKKTGTPPQALEIELTESALIEDLSDSLEVLKQLRDIGVDIAIDDFGTGYSSFSRLQRLPVTRVKIDRTFIQDIPHNTSNESIVRAIISVAHELKMEVVAEGVETHSQAKFLSTVGCDLLQGYYVGEPGPVSRIAAKAKLKTSHKAAALA